jgi:ribosome-binding factor A
MARINKQLQREISLLLEQRIKNDGAKNAIITGVDCARDLETARVYFTTLDPAIRPEVLVELQNVKGALRTMLGHGLKLRHVPALEFLVDQSQEYGRHIDDVLRRLGLDSHGKEAEGDDDAGDEDEDGDEETEEGGQS